MSAAQPCTTDKEAWRKVRDLLVAAKDQWIAMNYGTAEALPKGDFLANAGWNGAAFRARLKNPAIKFGFPKEGFPIWMDNVAHPRRRPERREREAVPELHHGSRRTRP